MDEKLDELTATAKDLAGKPAKRWEALVSCIISALAGAFLVWLASGMPGVGK
jgi:ABC-type transport system involved in multi-copper enzyme maturation permease subunit